MERREFLSVTSAALVLGPTVRRPNGPPAHQPVAQQTPILGPTVFSQRISRAQAELKSRKLDLLVVEPSTNFQYFTGYNPGRSERLILLMIPASGTPAIVCPSFEVERIKRNTVIGDARGWEEQEDPWLLVAKAAQQMKPPGRAGEVAVEPTTSYQSYVRLTTKVRGWIPRDGTAVTERLRIIKSPEEIALIRQAIAATEASIAATFSQLAIGLSERDVAQLLSREMASRGSPGGGLVQFGPSSALPHGGPSAGGPAPATGRRAAAGARGWGAAPGHTRPAWVWGRPA